MMDEYSYSGLDQVVNEDEDALGPEDGEDVVHEFGEWRRVLVIVDNIVRELK
jgi:hypothetical protein